MKPAHPAGPRSCPDPAAPPRPRRARHLSLVLLLAVTGCGDFPEPGFPSSGFHALTVTADSADGHPGNLAGSWPRSCATA